MPGPAETPPGRNGESRAIDRPKEPPGNENLIRLRQNRNRSILIVPGNANLLAYIEPASMAAVSMGQEGLS